MKTIGLIAGNGKFPIMAAQEARSAGYKVVACAIEKEADPAIERVTEACSWVKLGELKKLVRFFREHAVEEAFMAGKVEKVRLFQQNVRPDMDMVRVVMKTRDFKDDTLLAAIAGYLGEKGIRLIDSTSFLKSSLGTAGILTRKKPSAAILEDIRFGFRLAKAVGGLDIGQTVIVKQKAVLAVEAIEGTDEAIRRAGKLGGKGATVVKVAKPNQDMRFDVPAVGLRTMEELIDIGAAAFAYEADKTIILDREEMIEKANRYGLIMIGVNEET